MPNPAKRLRLDAVREKPDTNQEARWVGYVTIGGREFPEMSLLSDEQLRVELKAVEKPQRESQANFDMAECPDNGAYHVSKDGRREPLVNIPDQPQGITQFSYSKQPRENTGWTTFEELRSPRRRVIERVEQETMAAERVYAVKFPGGARYVKQKIATTYSEIAPNQRFFRMDLENGENHITVPQNLNTFVGDQNEQRTKGGFTSASSASTGTCNEHTEVGLDEIPTRARTVRKHNAKP